MTIYLDIVFLENLCMNYIILFATGIINKTNINRLRILLSSLLGSVYAIISFVTNLQIYTGITIKILLSIAMINIAFKPNTVRKCFKEIIIFYLTSFAFGGCAFFLLYYIRPQDILTKNGIYIGSYPIKIALLGGVVGFIIVNLAFKLIKGKMSKKDMFCDITISLDGKKAKAKAMIDSGNLLKDPISKSPVVVVEKKIIKRIISETILDEIFNILNGKDVNLDDSYMSRVRMLPFASLGKQNGMLIGLKPDSISIIYDDEQKEIKDVIVGIYDKTFTKNGTYTALIGLDLIQNRSEEFEYTRKIKV